MKKPLKIAVGIAMTYSAAAYALTTFFLKTATDRELPKIYNRISAKNPNFLAKSSTKKEIYRDTLQAAEKLKNQPHERIELIARDGTKLVGHWFPVEDPKRIIIAMHGWRSNWYNDFGMMSEMWKENGCCVLYAEQRGQNESGGKYIGFGELERYDCVDWTAWVTKNIDAELPIYLAGVSLGAATVLLSADLNFPGNVRGIMADCGFTSPNAEWRHVAAGNLGVPYGLIGIMSRAGYARRIGEDSRHSTVDAIKNSKLPLMLVHGENDHFVPVSMTYENYNACTADKELLIVPEADHAMSYYYGKEDYDALMLTFWRKHDN